MSLLLCIGYNLKLSFLWGKEVIKACRAEITGSSFSHWMYYRITEYITPTGYFLDYFKFRSILSCIKAKKKKGSCNKQVLNLHTQNFVNRLYGTYSSTMFYLHMLLLIWVNVWITDPCFQPHISYSSIFPQKALDIKCLTST